jgi:thioredoxin-related protein
MIEIILVYNSKEPSRPERIFEAVFERASSLLTEENKIIFQKKDRSESLDLIDEYQIKVTPTTLFFKDRKLKIKEEGIMATEHIYQILKRVKYL